MKYTIRFKLFGWFWQLSNLERKEPEQTHVGAFRTVVVKHLGPFELQRGYQTTEQAAAEESLLSDSEED